MSCEIKGEDFEARAKEAERKAFQAAQHGQELLLKLEENAKILDQLTQEKHEMKMALQSKEAAVDALEEELQVANSRSRTERDKLEKLWKEDLEQRKHQWSNKEAELDEKILSLKAELMEHSEKLAASVPLPKSPNVSLTMDPEVHELREKVEDLQATCESLKVDNAKLKAEHEGLSFTNHSKNQRITELEINLDEKEAELASYRESMRQTKDDLLMLQMEADDDDPFVDVAPKGNSLFSEVEDRRQEVEKQLKKYKAKLEEFKIQYDKKVQEIRKLKMSNIQLMNLTASGGSGNGTCNERTLKRMEEFLQQEKNKNTSLQANYRTLLEAVKASDHGSQGGSSKGTSKGMTLYEAMGVPKPKTSFSGSQGKSNYDWADQLERMIHQNLVDGERMDALLGESKKQAQEIDQLKVENFRLRSRLEDMTQPRLTLSSTSSTSSLPASKEDKMEKQNSASKENTDPAIIANSKRGQIDATAERRPSKSVTIMDNRPESVKKAEEEGLRAKPKKSGIKTASNIIINAEEQNAEWQEQCAQQ